jgi:hypothetical protein
MITLVLQHRAKVTAKVKTKAVQDMSVITTAWAKLAASWLVVHRQLVLCSRFGAQLQCEPVSLNLF